MTTSERASPGTGSPAASDPSPPTTKVDKNVTSALPLAARLLAAGIPIVVVGYGERYQPRWQSITAPECDLSDYQPGRDALAMVGGHGIDAVDVDIKGDRNGSVENLPPFTHYGITRSPSGGQHYIVPSSGLAKIAGLTTEAGFVGDYVGGTKDGDSRMLLFLPGSVRSKYPGVPYTLQEPWDVEACVAATPEPRLVAALAASQRPREARAEPHSDDSLVRGSALGLHPYAAAAIAGELGRLDECSLLGWGGPLWDNTHYEVACNLQEFANANWTGYTIEQAEADFMDRAASDEKFGPSDHAVKWASARAKVGDYARPSPTGHPADAFAVVADRPPVEPSGVLARFPRLRIRELLDLNRPEREYVVEPMVGAGTSVALVAPAGHRKSLLVLRMAVAVARGEPEFAGMAIPRARRVLYVDQENTEDDLKDRLLSFGLTPDQEIDNLILLSLTAVGALDTVAGGSTFLQVVDAYGLETGDVVVLDSYQRITEAGENDSDTTRGYYRHTGIGLKARGLTVIRTDNTGKDASRGARGSSGKRDDVDVEYLLRSDGDYLELTTGKARQRGVPHLSIYIGTNEDGLTMFRSNFPSPAMAKQSECVARLDELGLPDQVSGVKALAALEQAGDAFPRAVVRVACALRRARTDQTRQAFAGRELRV